MFRLLDAPKMLGAAVIAAGLTYAIVAPVKYGAVTPPDKPETDITGPAIPLDAVPGRGRLVKFFAWDCNVLLRALGWSITEVQGPIEFEIVARRP